MVDLQAIKYYLLYEIKLQTLKTSILKRESLWIIASDVACVPDAHGRKNEAMHQRQIPCSIIYSGYLQLAMLIATNK